MPRTPAGGALHAYLGELITACSALMENGAGDEEGSDPFWSQRTARLATLAGRAREEDGECEPHRWHAYQVFHQRLAAADRWPVGHRPYLCARAAHVRRAMQPKGAPGGTEEREEEPETGDDRGQRAPRETLGEDHAAVWGRGLPCEAH